jgi:curved DNA-binding protein CbpA
MLPDDALPLHYEALGVPEDASVDAIRSAWREIAHRSHPDKVGADPYAAARFKRASEAWSVLRSEESRAEYDAQLRESRIPTCPNCGKPFDPRGGLYCPLCTLAKAPKRKTEARPPRPAASPPPPAPPPHPSFDPFAGETPEHRARREAEEQRIYDRTRVYDDINGVHAPSADGLLEALLTDAALRSGGSVRPSKKRKQKKSRLEVKVSPSFTVALEGEAAETLDDVNSNLRLANRLLKSITRFFR